MASNSILAFVIFLTVLFLYLLLMKDPSAHYKQGLSAKAGGLTLKVAPSRKLVEALYALRDEKTSSWKDDIERMHAYGEAFRKIPSGPDPLHHNRANPKNKPKTP